MNVHIYESEEGINIFIGKEGTDSNLLKGLEAFIGALQGAPVPVKQVPGLIPVPQEVFEAKPDFTEPEATEVSETAEPVKEEDTTLIETLVETPVETEVETKTEPETVEAPIQEFTEAKAPAEVIINTDVAKDIDDAVDMNSYVFSIYKEKPKDLTARTIRTITKEAETECKQLLGAEATVIKGKITVVGNVAKAKLLDAGYKMV